jgi:signal transduction histidine kinase/ActR/RegA family two-component response regulator
MDKSAWVVMRASEDRQILADALASGGLAVRAIDNLDTAFEALAADCPLLVIFEGCDWQRGHQLLQAACDSGRQRRFPCIVAARDLTLAMIEKWLEAGAADYVTLPTTRQLARARIVSVLSLEQQCRKTAEAEHRAECALRLKQEFLRNLSHELRTPLTAVRGTVDALLNDGDLKSAPATRLEMLRLLDSNVDAFTARTDSLMQLAQLDAGCLEISLRPAMTLELLAAARDQLQRQAVVKGLQYSIAFHGPVPKTIQTDSLRFKQVLHEVIHNALKFTSHGSIHVECRLLANHCPTLWQVDVIDTGTGMTCEELRRLFHPFTQADTSATRQFGGLGIGLTITKRLLNMLGGDIHIQSTPGQGTTVSLTLETGPLDGVATLSPEAALALLEGPAKSSPTPPSTHEPTRLAGRILLAEDSPDSQQLISFLLRRAGAEVTTVDDGQHAFDAAIESVSNGSPFDLILMDMQMPILDGYRATELLRSRGYTYPIVALTAHSQPGERESCLAAGCDDYFTKPIDRKSLLSLASAYCRGSEGNSPRLPSLQSQPVA